MLKKKKRNACTKKKKKKRNPSQLLRKWYFLFTPDISTLIPSKVLYLLPLGAGRAQVPTPRGPRSSPSIRSGRPSLGCVPPPLHPEKSQAGISQLLPCTSLYLFLTWGKGGPGPWNTESLRGGGKYHSFLQKAHTARKTGDGFLSQTVWPALYRGATSPHLPQG